MLRLVEVIFEIVKGILEATIVKRTIYIDSVRLYIPNSNVDIILLRYILYKKPKNLVNTLNAVKVSIAFIIFLIISPPIYIWLNLYK